MISAELDLSTALEFESGAASVFIFFRNWHTLGLPGLIF